MLNTPYPKEIKMTLALEEVEEYKRIDCKHYDDCLMIAAQAEWNQYTCNECSAYQVSDARPVNFVALSNLMKAVFSLPEEDE